MFPDTSSKSAALFQRAQAVLAGGNTRFSVHTDPYQVYAARGAGSRVVDVDGIERIDLQNNMTVLVHGHAHPAVVARVDEQLHRGSCFGLATESEIALAEVLCERIASFDLVRFVNSGTEAVMTAMKAARAFTGRRMIARIEGTYNGSYDYAEVSLSSTPADWGPAEAPRSVAYAAGTPQSVLDEVAVIRFNDPAGALQVLDRCRDDLAAVLIDPMPARIGLLPAQQAFLDTLRDFTRDCGALLIFDEVICFRLGYHGAQGVFACEPDLTALGKVIGGGFPVGAVGGRGEVMGVFDMSRGQPPIVQGGTFNANPISMEAGLATLELLTEDALERINALGEHTRDALRAAFDAEGCRGQVTGRGSLFRFHFTDRLLTDYRSYYPSPQEQHALKWMWRYLLNNGMLLSKMGMGALSTVNTRAEVDQFAETFRQGLRLMQAQGLAAA